MDDKLIMNTLLTETKSICDLMMHGAIESSTPDVHAAFSTAASDALCIQNEIYNKMTEKGWYTQTAAEQQKIAQTKQKFSGQ